MTQNGWTPQMTKRWTLRNSECCDQERRRLRRRPCGRARPAPRSAQQSYGGGARFKSAGSSPTTRVRAASNGTQRGPPKQPVPSSARQHEAGPPRKARSGCYPHRRARSPSSRRSVSRHLAPLALDPDQSHGVPRRRSRPTWNRATRHATNNCTPRCASSGPWFGHANAAMTLDVYPHFVESSRPRGRSAPSDPAGPAVLSIVEV